MIAVLCTTSREIFSLVHYVVFNLGLPESWAGQYVDVVLSIFVTIVLTIAALLVWRRIRRTEAKNS